MAAAGSAAEYVREPEDGSVAQTKIKAEFFSVEGTLLPPHPRPMRKEKSAESAVDPPHHLY